MKRYRTVVMADYMYAKKVTYYVDTMLCGHYPLKF